MSLWSKIGIIISFLLILDGLMCLIFLDRVEGLIKQIFPRLNLIPIAAIEIFAGGILGLAIVMWR